MQELLGENLKQADNLRLGQLENGLRYVMLPNKVPPQRFEAHLEMHAGWYACRHACKKGPITGRNDHPFCSKLVVRLFKHETAQVMHCSIGISAGTYAVCAQGLHVEKVPEQMAVGSSRQEMNRCIQCRQCGRAAN